MVKGDRGRIVVRYSHEKVGKTSRDTVVSYLDPDVSKAIIFL